MPLWIQDAITALRNGSGPACGTAQDHDRSARYYQAEADSGRFSGGIRADLLALATEHRVAAQRLGAAGGWAA